MSAFQICTYLYYVSSLDKDAKRRQCCLWFHPGILNSFSVTFISKCLSNMGKQTKKYCLSLLLRKKHFCYLNNWKRRKLESCNIKYVFIHLGKFKGRFLNKIMMLMSFVFDW